MAESTIQQRADDDSAREFAADLMARIKMLNKSEGVNLGQALWIHSRFRALPVTVTSEIAAMLPGSGLDVLIGVSIAIDLMNLIISGDLECAYAILMACDRDDMTQAYHWLNNDRLNWIRHEIGVYLGWEPA